MSETIFDTDKKRRERQRREVAVAERTLHALRQHADAPPELLASAKRSVIHSRLRYWGWTGKLPAVAT